MLRKKYCNLTIVIIVILFFNWVLTTFLPYKSIAPSLYNNVALNEKDVILSVLLNSGGYESLINMVFLLLAYLLSLNYLLAVFKPHYIVRFKSKIHFFKFNFINCAFLSLLFVFIKVLIGVICSTGLFNYGDLQSLSYYNICLLNFFLPVLFYLYNGLILLLLNYHIGKKYSVIIVFLFNLFQYAMLKFHIANWIFIKDATKFAMLISGEITDGMFLSSLFRNSLYILLISFIGINKILNKDNFLNEKK